MVEGNGEPSWKRYTRLFPAISFSPKERLRFDVEDFRVVENSDRRLRSFFDDSPPCALRTIYNRWEFDRPNKTSRRNFGKRNSHCEKFPGKRGMFQRSVILMKYLSEGKGVLPVVSLKFPYHSPYYYTFIYVVDRREILYVASRDTSGENYRRMQHHPGQLGSRHSTYNSFSLATQRTWNGRGSISPASSSLPFLRFN